MKLKDQGGLKLVSVDLRRILPAILSSVVDYDPMTGIAKIPKLMAAGVCCDVTLVHKSNGSYSVKNISPL
ncbi:MAG: hypothetical protein HOP02_03350 [Methylococcaceae bacterium]|nr:hypothetical protein [Methylococcaceae bacterium]